MTDVAGRVLWLVVTAAWPAVTALRAEFRMHWWPQDLTWALALAEAACAVLLRARQARARERRHDREAGVRDLRIAQLEAEVSAYGKALSAMAAYGQLANRPGALVPVPGEHVPEDCQGPRMRRLRSVPLREGNG